MNDGRVLNTECRERKKEENNSVLNTVLNTVRIVKSFSAPPTFCNTLQQFTFIIEREGLDFSGGIRKAIIEFVKNHPLPNPQADLQRLLALDMPHKPANQCCVSDCHNKRSLLMTLKNYEGKTEQFPVCHSHRRWRHPTFRFLVAYKHID